MSCSRLLLAAAWFAIGCASQAPEQKVETPAAAPRADAERIAELAELDRDNQAQLEKIQALESKVAHAQASCDLASPAPAAKAPAGLAPGSRVAESILFERGSANLTPEGKKAVAHIAALLKQSPKGRVEIAGHTDDRPYPQGSKMDNWQLAFQRAHAVYKLLRSDGVDLDRIDVTSNADLHPAEPGTSDEARTANRRVEVLLAVPSE